MPDDKEPPQLQHLPPELRAMLAAIRLIDQALDESRPAGAFYCSAPDPCDCPGCEPQPRPVGAG